MSSDQSDTPSTPKPLAKQLGEAPKVIFQYTRAQALVDGNQIDVSETAREAGIRFPTFITRGVFDQYVAVPKGVEGQDESGRLWDVVFMLRRAIIQSKENTDHIPFQLYVRNTNAKPKLVSLFAACGPLDIDNPAPAITVMLPGED
jgi:hypothetical protein